MLAFHNLGDEVVGRRSIWLAWCEVYQACIKGLWTAMVLATEDNGHY